jgi:5-methylcytosine-specific restriction endonuclease McrA
MARSRRYEFPKAVMREAAKRAGGRCEAVGVAYGLEPSHRCNAVLVAKEFDHYPLPATMEGSDTLANCVVCCPACHKHKTRTLDIPVQAKTKRVSDRHNGIRKAPTMRSAGFAKAPKQHSATRPIEKWSLLK